jgi:ATP-dependent helicase/nuclease subunit A
VFSASEDESLLHVGTIDLLALHGDTAIVIDFKSDRPPATSVEADYPQYVRQLAIYGSLVQAALSPTRVESLVIFTKTGAICRLTRIETT